MDLEAKKEIAMFRYGVISDLIGGVRLEKGDFESLLKDKADTSYSIPFSNRTSISITTIRRWVSAYLRSNRSLEALYPKERKDTGDIRVIDKETAATLLNLKKEMPKAPANALIKIMKERNLIAPEVSLRKSTVYRFFKIHSEDITGTKKTDRRRFEAEMPNDIWQSDVMHGPQVKVSGKMKKTYLIACIDDHSRLITHAQFYLSENLETYLSAFQAALRSKGMPRKLYVDNGSAFRAKHLEFICASLDISLVHSPPYTPQGRGKIERFFKTVRSSFLSIISRSNLEALNLAFSIWLEDSYQSSKHSATSQTPEKRFMKHLKIIRPAPTNLTDFFRNKARRRVTKDRVITIDNIAFEAPVSLVSEQVDVLYHKDDPGTAEIFFKNQSYGFLTLLDQHVNCRVSRKKDGLKVEDTPYKEEKNGQLSFNQETE
jgi:putative transposase